MIYLRGNEPTPDQRPFLSGFLAACVATAASAWLLFQCGAMRTQAHALQIPRSSMIALQAAIWLGGGVLFGRVFSRAAADPRGGWLFGLACGYLLWMLGPATTMMWIAGGPVAKGPAAVGLLAAYILYGLAMGIAFPYTNDIFKPRLGERLQRDFNAAQDFAITVPTPAFTKSSTPPDNRPIPS
jgi:hypothetical protein